MTRLRQDKGGEGRGDAVVREGRDILREKPRAADVGELEDSSEARSLNDNETWIVVVVCVTRRSSQLARGEADTSGGGGSPSEMGLMVHVSEVMGEASLLCFPFPFLPPSPPIALVGVSTSSTSGPLMSAMRSEASLEAARKPMSHSSRQLRPLLLPVDEDGGRMKPAAARQPSWKGRGEGTSDKSTW